MARRTHGLSNPRGGMIHGISLRRMQQRTHGVARQAIPWYGGGEGGGRGIHVASVCELRKESWPSLPIAMAPPSISDGRVRRPMAVLDVDGRRAGHVARLGAFLSDGMQDKAAVQRGCRKNPERLDLVCNTGVGPQESQAPGRRWHWDPPWTVHSPARNWPFAVGRSVARSRNVSLGQPRQATAREPMLVHTHAGVPTGRNNRRLLVKYPLHTYGTGPNARDDGTWDRVYQLQRRPRRRFGTRTQRCTGRPERNERTRHPLRLCSPCRPRSLSRQPTLRLPGFICMRLCCRRSLQLGCLAPVSVSLLLQ